MSPPPRNAKLLCGCCKCIMFSADEVSFVFFRIYLHQLTIYLNFFHVVKLLKNTAGKLPLPEITLNGSGETKFLHIYK